MTQFRALVVDDDKEICRQIEEFIGYKDPDSDIHIVVDSISDFTIALEQLENTRYDILILDLKIEQGSEIDEEAGRRVLELVRARRFVPIVFYSGLAHKVRCLENGVIRVVEKTEGVSMLKQVIYEIIGTKLPAINKALIEHFEEIQRKYMWEYVADNWDRIKANTSLIAYLMARRLAVSLSGSGMNGIFDKLKFESNPDHVHPIQYYIMPPEEEIPLAGDLYHGQIGDCDGYWILLTPSCDVRKHSLDYVLLGYCVPLEQTKQYAAYLKENSSQKLGNIISLIKNGVSDRNFFLPGVLEIPNLVVDFQQLIHFTYVELKKLTRLASLDTAFAGELQLQFVRYYGRKGALDLNYQSIIEPIKVLGEADKLKIVPAEVKKAN
jgi:CheY-like chemotaxis protein